MIDQKKAQDFLDALTSAPIAWNISNNLIQKFIELVKSEEIGKNETLTKEGETI